MHKKWNGPYSCGADDMFKSTADVKMVRESEFEVVFEIRVECQAKKWPKWPKKPIF